MIGRDPEVGCTVLQHREHGLDDAAGRSDLDAVAVKMSGPRRVILGGRSRRSRRRDERSHPRACHSGRELRAALATLRSGSAQVGPVNIASQAAVSQEANRSSVHPRSPMSRCHNVPSIVAKRTSRHSSSVTASCPSAAASAYRVRGVEPSLVPLGQHRGGGGFGRGGALQGDEERGDAPERRSDHDGVCTKRSGRSGSARTSRISGRSRRRTSFSSPRKLAYQT